MKKIEWLRDVTSPADQCGETGDVRQVDDRIARNLVAGGYAREIKNKTRKKGTKANVDERADSKS